MLSGFGGAHLSPISLFDRSVFRMISIFGSMVRIVLLKSVFTAFVLSRVPDACFTTGRRLISGLTSIFISYPELIGLIIVNVGGAAILSDVLGLILIRVSPLKI
jgi:hypothetical protein